MKKTLFVTVSGFLFLFSCSNPEYFGYEIPEDCNGRCEFAHDMNSFKDAAVNSAARFSNCVCLKKGVVEGEVTVSKPLKIIGRKDGTSLMTKISFHGVEDALLSNVTFKNIAVKESAVSISGSSVKLENVSFSNIRAGSIFGGRAVVVSGEKSEVLLENVEIDKTDGTGLLIDGIHKIKVESSTISNCGFAGIWVQNSEGDDGAIEVFNSNINNIGAVSLQILGSSKLKIANSKISGVNKREINLEVVGDGIVIKNPKMNLEKSVVIKDIEIEGFYRAGIILDGEANSLLNGVEIKNISIFSKTGEFGAVVQNGKEPDDFREGFKENPFLEKDLNLSEPLYIIETIQEM
ncbi:MAG: right-handed parallel beta-helix repeat-containing protein [bacterium]